MGSFAKVALPVAVAIAAPYAAAAMGTAGVAGASPYLLSVAPTATATTVSPWLVAVNAGMTGLREMNALRQEKSQAAYARARNDADRARVQREYEVAERKRREDLRRSLASQRARFGASGVSSASGSASALLNGLQKRTDDASRDHLDAVQQGIASNNRLNLLEESSKRKTGQYQLFRKTVSPFINLLEQ
jgi:hypothetical protein